MSKSPAEAIAARYGSTAGRDDPFVNRSSRGTERPTIALAWRRVGRRGRSVAAYEHEGQWLIASVFAHANGRYVWEVCWDSPSGRSIVALDEALSRRNAKALCAETIRTVVWFASLAREA